MMQTIRCNGKDETAAAGEWTGVYCKLVGSEDGVTDEPFSLELKAGAE